MCMCSHDIILLLMFIAQ